MFLFLNLNVLVQEHTEDLGFHCWFEPIHNKLQICVGGGRGAGVTD